MKKICWNLLKNQGKRGNVNMMELHIILITFDFFCLENNNKWRCIILCKTWQLDPQKKIFKFSIYIDKVF